MLSRWDLPSGIASWLCQAPCVRSERASCAKSLRGSHRTIDRMNLRNTMFDSRHRSQLRSQRTPPRQSCRTAYLRHYRCIRIRFGRIGSWLCRLCQLFQLSDQFTDALTRRFVLMELLFGCSYPSILSKKLSLLSQMSRQFSAYLRLSFFVPWNIAFAHNSYSLPLRFPCNPAKYLFRGVKK